MNSGLVRVLTPGVEGYGVGPGEFFGYGSGSFFLEHVPPPQFGPCSQWQAMSEFLSCSAAQLNAHQVGPDVLRRGHW